MASSTRRGSVHAPVAGPGDGNPWPPTPLSVRPLSPGSTVILEVGRTVYSAIHRALCLYSECCVRAFDEGNAGDWKYIAPAGLIGDRPLVDAFSLGQLTQQRDMFVNNGPSQIWDVRGEVLTLLAKEEYRQVLNTLRDRWGERELFAALYGSRGTTATLYPLDDDLRNQVFSGDRAQGTRRAWDWYDAGAGLES
jgi:hypothetical protein